MKHFLPLFLLSVALHFNVAAQVCTPDPAVISAGTIGPTPSPQVGLPDGDINVPYSQVITFVVPNDTTITVPGLGSFTVTVNYWEITGVSGLPPGLADQCNASPCKWNGGSNGCVKISGTPLVGGDSTVLLATIMNVTLPPPLGLTQSVPTPLPYNMHVEDPNSIGDELNPNAFGVSQNVPNPFNGVTRIKFSSPNPSNIHFSMMNQFGQVVMEKNIVANSGVNELSVDVSSLSNGIYFYNLNNGDETSATLKMVVLE